MQVRSLLVVPADSEGAVALAGSAPVDAIILDVEGAATKEEARLHLAARVAYLASAGRQVFLRPSRLESGLTRDDLAAAVGPTLDGLVLPAEEPRHVREFDVLVREQEMAKGVKPGTVALVVEVHSPRGLLRCEELVRASNRTAAAWLNGADFAASLGVPRRSDGRELEYARRVIVTVCAAYGLLAIDAPPGGAEGEAVRAEAEYARSIGFGAKVVVDAAQVEAVNLAFRA